MRRTVTVPLASDLPSEENIVPQSKSCAAGQCGWAGLAKTEAVRGYHWHYPHLCFPEPLSTEERGQQRPAQECMALSAGP